jgi:hypothetical protein
VRSDCEKIRSLAFLRNAGFHSAVTYCNVPDSSERHFEHSEEEEEEEEESLFKADAVNEEDPERDRATQV